MVVAAGGDAENSTWSFDSGSRILTTISNLANVNASVVEGYLASGDLTIESANITMNADVSSSTANNFTLKATGDVNLSANKSITTNGGDGSRYTDYNY